MSKMFFNDPSIYRGPITPAPDPTPIIGGGSAQGGADPYACSYQDWLAGYGVDLVSPEGIDEADYVQWWTNMMNAGYSGFTSEAWNSLNPDWSGSSPFNP